MGEALSITNLEKETRKIFHKIHLEQGEDKNIFKRISSLLTIDYFKLDNDYFVNKVCLDAGCGSNANATMFMLKMGAQKVCLFDLDKSILESVPEYLKGYEGKYELNVDNVLNMNYPDGFFDFVYCCGVLHHTHDPIMGIKELARVTKSGGILYVLTNGKGGLMHELTEYFRKKYISDKSFRGLINNLDKKHFAEIVAWLIKTMNNNGDKLASRIPRRILDELFDDDLVLTIKDRLTAPLYHGVEEKKIISVLKEQGFGGIKRLRRYPRISNIRRFFSPLYFDYENKFSKLMYGEGCIQIKAVKVKKQRQRSE
jgi:ubiquinone/menaquinone biosynthesis C-methylase UbiE